METKSDVLLSVVMPCYNERQTIREIVRRVLALPLAKELIIVDDASSDGSREILTSLAARHPEIQLLLQPKNRGKGAALRSGFARARGQIVAIQDADLEYDPAQLPALIEPILADQADVVYGSRFMGGPRRVLLFWHTVGNRLLTLLSNMCTNLNLTDMETCYKVFRRDVLDSFSLRSDRFGFEPEFTQKVARLRFRVFEMPIRYAGRDYVEGKKINWKDGVAAVYTILRHALIEDSLPQTLGYQTLNSLRQVDRYNAWIYRALAPHLGEKVLEIGAGTGNITRFLLPGRQVVATDYRESYLALLRRAFAFAPDLALEKLDLNDFDSARWAEQSFDSIVLLNVLEHIADDRGALARLRQAMAPHTRLLLLVPAHGWLYGSLDRHLEHHRRYEKAQLQRLLEEVGLVPASLSYFNPLAVPGWWFNSRLLRRKLLGTTQLRFFNALVPLARCLNRLPLPLGISLLAVCRRGEAG